MGRMRPGTPGSSIHCTAGATVPPRSLGTHPLLRAARDAGRIAWIALVLSGSARADSPSAPTSGPLSSDPPSSPNLSVDAVVKESVAKLIARQESIGGDVDARQLPTEWPYEGSFRPRDARGSARVPMGYRVGGTAVVVWALLEAPGWSEDAARPRREAVDRALRFLVESVDSPEMSTPSERSYDIRTWGHIYALRAFVCVEQHDRVPPSLASRLKSACRTSITRLEASALPRVGGWNYSRRSAAPATFMTAAGLQSLLAARSAGYSVPEKLIEGATRALLDGRLDSGAFQYASRPLGKRGTDYRIRAGFGGARATVRSDPRHGGTEPPGTDRAIGGSVLHSLEVARRSAKKGRNSRTSLFDRALLLLLRAPVRRAVHRATPSGSSPKVSKATPRSVVGDA